jgi:hypothetical protein
MRATDRSLRSGFFRACHANVANTPSSVSASPNQVSAYCRWLSGIRAISSLGVDAGRRRQAVALALGLEIEGAAGDPERGGDRRGIARIEFALCGRSLGVKLLRVSGARRKPVTRAGPACRLDLAEPALGHEAAIDQDDAAIRQPKALEDPAAEARELARAGAAGGDRRAHAGKAPSDEGCRLPRRGSGRAWRDRAWPSLDEAGMAAGVPAACASSRSMKACFSVMRIELPGSQRAEHQRPRRCVRIVGQSSAGARVGASGLCHFSRLPSSALWAYCRATASPFIGRSRPRQTITASGSQIIMCTQIGGS